MRAIALVFLTLLLGELAAQEYEPFPHARITPQQWQQYFTEVSSKHAGSRREFPAEHLVIFEDRETYTAYAFTQPGHAAHPAWLTRRVVQGKVGANVRQIGYFAGEEEPFRELFKAYLQLNAQMFERRIQEGQK